MARKDVMMVGGENGKSLSIGKKLSEQYEKASKELEFTQLPEEVKQVLLKRAQDKENKKLDLTTLDKIGGKHMLEMILYINEKSPIMKSDIYNDISRSSTMAGKIDTLHELGLIEIYNTGFTNTSVVVITESGKHIAELIVRMVETIDGAPDPRDDEY